MAYFNGKKILFGGRLVMGDATIDGKRVAMGTTKISGNGNLNTINHNLGYMPECVLIFVNGFTNATLQSHNLVTVFYSRATTNPVLIRNYMSNSGSLLTPSTGTEGKDYTVSDTAFMLRDQYGFTNAEFYWIAY